jgi:hypothetical protein
MRIFLISLIAALFLILPLSAQAQLKEDLMAPPQRVDARVTHTLGSGKVGDWANLIPVTMTHGYSMSFGSFGGRYQNLNAYTNSMQFNFSDRFQANVDLALLHSPFGGSIMMQNQNPMGIRFVVENASFSYKLSENVRFDVCFSQTPYGSGFSGGANRCGGGYSASPYGAYGFGGYAPYGAYGPYGPGNRILY